MLLRHLLDESLPKTEIAERATSARCCGRCSPAGTRRWLPAHRLTRTSPIGRGLGPGHTAIVVERRENVILLGLPGVGKSHLAVSSPSRRSSTGASTTARWPTSSRRSRRAEAAGRLSRRLKTLVFPSVLVVDEVGYLPIIRTGAMLFFQLMSRRYEHASTALTSNKGFDEWGEIVGNE